MLTIDSTGITIFDYRINYEILILIGIVYLILVGYTVCSCCNVPRVMEAMTNIVSNKNVPDKYKNQKTV